MTVASCVYLLWAAFGVLEPLYVRDVLGGSDAMFALLQTVFGVGLVLTGLLLAVVGERIARPRYVALAMIVSGATAALYLGHRVGGGRVHRRVPVGRRHRVLLRARAHAAAALRAGRVPRAGAVAQPVARTGRRAS